MDVHALAVASKWKCHTGVNASRAGRALPNAVPDRPNGALRVHQNAHARPDAPQPVADPVRPVVLPVVAVEVAVPGVDVRVARLLMGAADQTRQTSVVRAHPNAVSAHAPNPRLSQSRARDPEAALRSI